MDLLNLISSVSLNPFLFGSTAAALISIISFKLRLLTKSGAVSSFILGTVVFSFGQFKWSIPLIAFFLFSNLVSKVGKTYKRKFENIFDKHSQRDSHQVLANGSLSGFFVIIYLFYPDEIFYLLYIGSLSAVSADTWATEIGTMRETVTYNVLTLKKTNQGSSGGVSMSGFLGALLGTIIIAFSAIFWIHLNIIYYFCLIIFSGMIGAYIDSVLGASVQLQNKCTICGEITERKIHCGQSANQFSGIKFITNDFINFTAAVSGAVTVFFINVIMN